MHRCYDKLLRRVVLEYCRRPCENKSDHESQLIVTSMKTRIEPMYHEGGHVGNLDAWTLSYYYYYYYYIDYYEVAIWWCA